MLHETPNRFGKNNSQKIMGLQMAFAYVGSVLLPPASGYIAAKTTIRVLPLLLLFFTVSMLAASELINLTLKKNSTGDPINSTEN